jgi:glyoxylase-like metal-dependent hydrolase (beta-lactamase superfamily II)
MALPFPPEVHVLVRDWLSANHVLLRGDDGAVLVDTGYVRHVPFTLALLRTKSALGDAPLAKIVNTHCHSDHMGGNAAIARAYGCPIAVPEREAPMIEAWDEQSLLLDYADQSAERFTVGETLRAGETYRWGNLDWEAIAAPGHDMGALCFFNAEHGLLISGDALWANGFGFVMPPQIDPQALPATRATLETLSRLPIRIVIPGHGEPFDDVDAALSRAFRRLESFESDLDRMVRHALKVVLMFKLLDCQGLRFDDMPGYVERVGLYRDFNARFLGIPPAALAKLLVDDLLRAGAARCENGWIMPAVAGPATPRE